MPTRNVREPQILVQNGSRIKGYFHEGPSVAEAYHRVSKGDHIANLTHYGSYVEGGYLIHPGTDVRAVCPERGKEWENRVTCSVPARGNRLECKQTMRVINPDNCSDAGDIPVTATMDRLYVCGPNITSELMNVFHDVKTKFKSKSLREKKALCDAIVISVENLKPKNWTKSSGVFDIYGLELTTTRWLYDEPFRKLACGTPSYGDPARSQIENLQLSPCGNSVQVGNECYLAGTVNYAFLGVAARLCNDEFNNYPARDLHSIIDLWKTFSFDWDSLTFDDPWPPFDFALWGYHGHGIESVPRGRAANRDYCAHRCGVDPKYVKLPWHWSPIFKNETPAVLAHEETGTDQD